MNRLRITFLTVIMLTACTVFGQSFHRSRAFEDAVAAKTRTLTGYPGENYKNNFSQYKITAKFDTETGILEGEETVVYHANMPGDYQNLICVNLYRNIYKKGVSRIRPCKPEDITDEGVEILEVATVNPSGEKQTLRFRVIETKLYIFETIQQGGKITLYIKWREKIAENTHHRGGKYGETTWFVPYWYPQIAVFDDIYGWDEVKHSGNEEFLLEFADYDVNLTVGGKMCVWATGELQNKNDIFSSGVISLWDKAKKSDSNVDIITSSNRTTALKKSENTWHFKADSVPDFVFGCSSDALWTGASVQLGKNKKRTFTSAVYHSNGFESTVSTIRKTLTYLSTKRPNVPYPYPHMTIFEGSGGMEFPMMVNEDYDDVFNSDFFTTSHEVTHSYFPFMTGMYQNRYAFMDEGLTMFVPQYFQNSEYINGKDAVYDAVRSMNSVMGSDDAVPVIAPSYSQTDMWIYTVNSYYKPQIAYTVLEDIVGEKVMDTILNVFTQSWRGKHPHPQDFFNLCETIGGVNLKDFFHSWFYTTNDPDLAVAEVKDNTVTIINKGGVMVPICLEITYKDGSVETIERNALCWTNGNNAVVMSVKKDIAKVELGKRTIPDYDKSDNSWSDKN